MDAGLLLANRVHEGATECGPGMKPITNRRFFWDLDFGRRANAESERYEALFGGNWLRPKYEDSNERRRSRWEGDFGGSGMGSETDRTLCRLGRTRMVMRSER